ncbi:MAG: hypothetical protein ACP5NV_02010 [Candidatus Woesearchaeota archaeon]
MEEQKSEFKRQTAFKCNINDLNKGIFVKKQGWESSYVVTDYGDFSRVNIIAVVVLKEEGAITLDDRTGQIQARVFDKTELISDINIGDLVLIIARPREYNAQKYLTIDLVKKIKNPGWIGYRKKELQLIQKIRDVSNIDTSKDAAVVESTSTMNSKEKIISLIKELDGGEGANIDDIITFSKIRNAEDIIQDFILRGEVFEYKPGKIKLM